MYYRFFGLDGPPFAITPDPKFVYYSERHQEALAHLLYGIGQGGGGGFVQLTGEVGTGKTTLCRLLLDELPDHVQPALILNPVLGPRELIAAICDELGVQYPVRATRKQLVDRLNRYLLEAHGRGDTIVLVIDEAQNLSPQALEQVRLLTNLETHTAKLLQIILIGQPELRELLRRPALRQLAQRVTARYHLLPLQPEETAAYVKHRLRVAGAGRCPFGRGALAELHALSGGVPRLVNVIADRALLAAYTDERDTISRAHVREAASEVLGEEPPAPRRRLAALAAVLLALLVTAGWFHRDRLATLAGASTPLQGQRMPALRAWGLLGRYWNADWPAGASSCDAAGDAGLACLSAEGGWDDLRQLSVPVLMELEPGEQWLLAREVDGAGVVSLPGEKRIGRNGVANHWTGRYVVLVRLPAALPPVLTPGDEGPGVAWLRERAAALGGDLPQEPARYDEQLRRWVRQFQSGAGLPATGIADAATLVLVAARSGERSS